VGHTPEVRAARGYDLRQRVQAVRFIALDRKPSLGYCQAP